MKTIARISASLLGIALLAGHNSAAARTKLVTLPDRASTVVNLENPSYSLLSEEREIALQKGENHIDFSWQGVSIDKNSIQLEMLSHPGEGDDATKIVNVEFPPNEAALTWLLYSPEARTERIRVSYLLMGIGRTFSYEFTVDPGETKAVFQQYFQMGNSSGENLDDAAIRIQQAEDWKRSVESGETRRFLSFENRALPVKKLYIVHPEPFSTRGEDGEIISLVYEIENAKANGLGTFLLRGGKARIYAEDPDGTTIFVGEDALMETAAGEKAELTLGTVKDVLLKRRVMDDKRENERKNTSRRTVLYDRVVHVRYEIENFKDKAATVRVVETVPSEAEIVEIDNDGVTTKRKSANELEITIDLAARPGGKDDEVKPREVNFTYRMRDIPE